MSKETTGKSKSKGPYKSPHGWHKVRIRAPDLFEKIRWDDVGEPGDLAHVRGVVKSTGRWELQALRLEKNHWVPTPSGLELVPVTDRARDALRDMEDKFGIAIAIAPKKTGDWQVIPRVMLDWPQSARDRATEVIRHIGLPNVVDPHDKLVWDERSKDWYRITFDPSDRHGVMGEFTTELSESTTPENVLNIKSLAGYVAGAQWAEVKRVPGGYEGVAEIVLKTDSYAHLEQLRDTVEALIG